MTRSMIYHASDSLVKLLHSSSSRRNHRYSSPTINMKVVAPTTIAIALSILHHIEAMRKPFVTSKRLQINNKGRQQVTPPITALDSFESSPISKIRGGHLVSDFADYIAQSSARCWCILILSILIDTGSTTLLKIGRDTSSIIKIFFSYGGFFLRCE
jgi:hypothetical protein